MNKEYVLQVGVKIFLRNSKGQYLLLKRSSARYPNLENMWDIPGGRIIPGTSLLENIKREVKEETNLDIDGDVEIVAGQDILRPDKHIVRITYKGHADGTPVMNNMDEEEDYRWLSLEEMRNWSGLDEYTAEVLASYSLES